MYTHTHTLHTHTHTHTLHTTHTHVCMHLTMHAHMHVHMHTYVHVRAHTRTHFITNIYMFVCMKAQVHLYTSTLLVICCCGSLRVRWCSSVTKISFFIVSSVITDNACTNIQSLETHRSKKDNIKLSQKFN